MMLKTLAQRVWFCGSFFWVIIWFKSVIGKKPRKIKKKNIPLHPLKRRKKKTLVVAVIAHICAREKSRSDAVQRKKTMKKNEKSIDKTPIMLYLCNDKIIILPF